MSEPERCPSIPTEQAPEEAGNQSASASLSEGVSDSAPAASKDADESGRSTDNPNSTDNLNNSVASKDANDLGKFAGNESCRSTGNPNSTDNLNNSAASKDANESGKSTGYPNSTDDLNNCVASKDANDSGMSSGNPNSTDDMNSCVASKDANELGKSTGNPDSTDNRNNGGSTVHVSAECVDRSQEADGSGENESGAGAAQDAEKSQKDPAVGMTFPTEDEAFGFYNAYARRKGFSVRKGHLSRRKGGTVRDRHFVCSFEGKPPPHRTHMVRKPRPVQKSNCLARLELMENPGDKRWIIKRFNDEHNHPLASPNKTFMLRSHRKKSAPDVLTESDFYYGVKPAPVQQLWTEEPAGVRDVPLVAKDQVSCLSTLRSKEFDKGNAQILLDVLSVKQSEDPSFIYAIQLDEKERLTNCFWTDARSVVDYSYFGDAVTLETTYRSSGFDLPFVAFLGVNHHKQVIVFGAALLLDESVESFTWLLRTFLAAMSGRQPKTILTDLSAAISKAVSTEMPGTCHRLCLWHILTIASKLVQGVSQEQNFREDFEILIYGIYPEDDFHREWDSLISKHGLADVPWFSELFTARERWSLVHCRNAFCGLTGTKKWSETMENLLKFRFYRKLPLSKFIVQYFNVITNLRQEELAQDHESWQDRPILLVDIPLLAEAAKTYTRTIYVDFEHEYRSHLACICERVPTDDATHKFRVSPIPQKQCSGIVEFNPANTTVSCSCKKFESSGILCMHALKVLNYNNILYLPSQYILRRWTKCAKDEQPCVPPGGTHQPVSGPETLSARYSRVCHKAVGLAAKGMLSKDALGHLERRFDSFIEQMEGLMHHNPSIPGPAGDAGGSARGVRLNPVEPNNTF